jgi:hypothetical protein
VSASGIEVHGFTSEETGLVNALFTEVKVAAAIPPGQPIPALRTYRGLWDTGATNTVITLKVVDDLGLKVSGMTLAVGVNSEDMVNTYQISLGLPNNVIIGDLKVSVGRLKGFDVLIGMDIIGLGDFCISNFAKQTVLTFRMPSIAKIDFLAMARAHMPKVSGPKAGPNQPCPCGSGSKFKKCCGKKS